jgi:hypothetical protein
MHFTMRRVRNLALLNLALLTFAGACSDGQDGGTPGQISGPAFEIVVLRQVACPSSLTAMLCERAMVTNRGEQGGGTCWLRDIGSNGDLSEAGITLTDIAPDQTVARTLAWSSATTPTPEGVGGYCSPGLRS